MLVQRRHVAQFETGDRTFPAVTGLRSWARPALLPLSSVAAVAAPDEAVVALTFDDGPDPVTTGGVLDALAGAGATATFFVLAQRAARHPELIARILDEGHEVGLHGDDHIRLSSLPTPAALTRVRRGRRRLEAVTGRPVHLFRPAYGALTAAQALAVRASGLEVVIWTAWARDWEGGSAATIADRAVAAVHPGAFLLLHDATGDPEGTPLPARSFDPGAVAELVLAGLRERGCAATTVGDLLSRRPEIRVPWFERARTGRAEQLRAAPAPV